MGGVALLNRKPAIYLKRGKIGPRLLLISNKKSYTRFRLVSKSTTLDDPGGHCALSFKTHASFGAHYENLNADRPTLSATKCCPMTLVYGTIRFVPIFAMVPWREGVKRQQSSRKRRFSGLSDATSAPWEMRPALLYSIIYSLDAFRLTPNYTILNDLEWLEWPFYVKFLLLRKDFESYYIYCRVCLHIYIYT